MEKIIMILQISYVLSLLRISGSTGNIKLLMDSEESSETKENISHSTFDIHLSHKIKNSKNTAKQITRDSKNNSSEENFHWTKMIQSLKNQEVINSVTTEFDVVNHVGEIIENNISEHHKVKGRNIGRHLLRDTIQSGAFYKEFETSNFQNVTDEYSKIINNSQHSLRRMESKHETLGNTNELFIGNDGYLEDRKPIISNLSYENRDYEIKQYTANEILKIFNRELPTLPDSLQENDGNVWAVNISREMNISDFDEVFTSWYKNLTKHFNCVVLQKEELNITCNNISLYNLGKYLPVNLENLDISNSPTALLSKPLFSHLTRLKFLRLYNNQHRFITKAFMGLESLEYLDLSKNNIMVIKTAFTYLTNLKSLNLSMNDIIRVGTMADSLGSLKHLEDLMLDHNWRIRQILKEELRPLKDCKIKKLTLLNTTMTRVDRGAFEYLSDLRELEVSVNYLNEEALTNITSSLVNSSIQRLFFRQCTLLSSFPYESLRFLENTSIYLLDLSYNYFPYIPKFPKITSLRSISMTNSKINIVSSDAFFQLPNLEELIITGNHLVSVFNTTYLKNLKTLLMYDQLLRFDNVVFQFPDFAFKSMRNLETLEVSRNLLPDILRRYIFYGLRNLKYFSLKSVDINMIEDFSFETLESLTILNLQRNKLRQLRNYTFYGLHNLTNLYISGNLLQFLPNVYPFQPLPSLRNILLDNNKIDTLPESLFFYNHHLEIVILSRNSIIPWSREIFQQNSSVSILSLSYNRIDIITSIMMSDFRQITSYLDISNNPLNCTNCGMIEFQDFLKSSGLNLGLPIDDEPEKYAVKCTTPKLLQNYSFLEVTLPLTDCSEIEKKLMDLSLIALIFLMLFFVAGTIYICYFFRWYVRYWIFRVEVKVKERNNRFSKSEKQYQYDAFVSYNSNDTAWIVTHLIPILEIEEPKLKLCIHERDFQVGRLITENILEAIETSKAVVLILSEEFIKSEWCMFELHMAQHRLFDEKRDSLILVKLKNVSKKLYTKNLSYLEKTRICLKWPDNLAEQKQFWNKLRKILGFPQISNE